MKANELAEAVAAAIGGAITPIRARVAALEDTTKAVGELAARIAVLEAREPVPGPPGPPGPAGVDGRDGQDGAPGLRYLGVYTSGKTYAVGDVVTHGGSAWHCSAPTGRAPGTSPDWLLMVKRGRNARDRV